MRHRKRNFAIPTISAFAFCLLLAFRSSVCAQAPASAAQKVRPPSAGQPGLYAGGRLLAPTRFEFTKKGMTGLAIPAYYDERYRMSGTPQVVPAGEARELYWVPQHATTLGENVLASKGGLYCFRVGSGGAFVQYNGGRSSGDCVDLKWAKVVDEVVKSHGGLVQQKRQMFRTGLPLEPGEYVLFQEGGNALDNEPHPETELGCWYLKVERS